MRLAFGCDHAGFPHKSVMIESLEADGHVVLDLGTFSEDPVDYPDFARVVANAVRNKFVDFGVLLCGSGVGASIAANKVRGIRAALVHDEFTAMQSRADDDANIVCLGTRVLDAETTASLALKFLATPFSNEPRHVRRVAKIAELETGLPKGAERVVRPASGPEGTAARGTSARPGVDTIPEAPPASPPPAAPAPPPASPPTVAAPAGAPATSPAAPAAPAPPAAPSAGAGTETVVASVAAAAASVAAAAAPVAAAAAPVATPTAPVASAPLTAPAATVGAPAPSAPSPAPSAPVAGARNAASVVEAPPPAPAPRSETRGRVEPAPDLQAALQEAAAAAAVRERPVVASPAPLAPEPVAVPSPAGVDVVEGAEVQGALKKLEDMEFVGRLWVKDATLWSDDPDVQASIRNRLGWLTSPTLMREYAADVKAFATEVRRLGFSNIVLLGMGGSSLAPEVMNLTFGSKMGFPDFAVLDSTDPAAVKNMLARLQLPRTLFVVSSKSGTTTEVLALYRFFRAQVEAGKPPKPGQNFVAITDPGSPLEKLAREGGFRRTFLNHPSIGGRFSALSFFGLVPAALIGVDIDRLLERATEMSVACGDAVQERQNPGIVLGAVLGGWALAGRNKVTFALSPKTRSFGSWLEQMIGESTGKDGKGLVPVDAERLGTPDVYGPDRLFVSIALASEATDPALDALEAAGHPVYRLTLKDPYDIGAEFFRWELGTAVAAALIGVNPFDEPNVAQAKDATLSMLAAFRKLKRLPDWPVDREEDGILLLTNQGTKPATLSAGLGAFLAQAKPGDYVAILAYLTPEHETTDALQTLATVIRDRLKVATTVDYGPRYLHSLGQLHKGGAPNLLAIQLTCDDKDDVPIPGEGYGFSALKAAQALGDLETLRKGNRRVIRLHLGGRAQTSIEKLTAMVRRTIQ